MSEQLTNRDINAEGHLTIGGVDALSLAQQYGTPLQVYDVSAIRAQIRAFKAVFEDRGVDYAVCYASKAFSAVAMAQVVAQEGGHLDVVSAGELYTAQRAHFPMAHVSFHGNNKLPEELAMALRAGVGVIMVDNFHELDLLSQLLEEFETNVQVMLRVTPGVSAHTHEYDQTGQRDSKFGFDVASGQADHALQIALANPRMTVQGVHAHIGSQIFEVAGFQLAAKTLVDLLAHWQATFGYEAQVLNVGGGFGIRYTAADDPIAPQEFVAAIIDTIKEETQRQDLALPAIWIEPGRSIVGPAGVTLYTVGGRKDVEGFTSYLTVDGGMGDNIRPALYQAEYEAVIANRPLADTDETVSIAGKYCESGDILIREQALPNTAPGDILALLDTGAYGYSMASNYNRNPRPAVVFAEEGYARVVVHREQLADLVRLDDDYVTIPTASN